MNDTKLLDDLRWASPPGSTGLGLLIWIAGVLLVVAALGFALWRQRAKEPSAPPRPPPHEVALDALRGLLPPTEENCLEFIVRISSILRTYIQDRFSLRAPHLSTEEFLQEASQSSLLSSRQQEYLGLFLHQCDMVKFARKHIVLSKMEGLYQTALQFVEETIPRAAVPEAKAVS